MPDIRGLLISILVGAIVAMYTILWWRWSVPAGLGVAVLLAGLALMTSAAFGGDPGAADAAWRAAAPDLVEPRPIPRDGTEPGPAATETGDPT